MKTYFLSYIINLFAVILLIVGVIPQAVYAAEDYNYPDLDIDDPYSKDLTTEYGNPDQNSLYQERDNLAKDNQRPESSNLDSDSENKTKQNLNSNNKNKSTTNADSNSNSNPRNNIKQNKGQGLSDKSPENSLPGNKADINTNSNPNNQNNDKRSPDLNSTDKNEVNSDSKNQNAQKENSSSNSRNKIEATPDSKKDNNKGKEDKRNKENNKNYKKENSNLNPHLSKEKKNNENSDNVNQIKKNSSSSSGNKSTVESNSNPESKSNTNSGSGIPEKSNMDPDSGEKNANAIKDKLSPITENKNMINSRIPQDEAISSGSRNENIIKKFANSKISDEGSLNSNNKNTGMDPKSDDKYFDNENIEGVDGNTGNIDVLSPGITDLNSDISDSKNPKNINNTNPANGVPDLIIEALFFEPENPEPGENTIFTVIVKNNGPAASLNNELTYTIIGTNETYVGKIPVSSLIAGQTSIGTFFWTPETEGKVEVKVEVKSLTDSYSPVSETDETNNKLTKTIIVGEKTAINEKENGKNKSSESNPESGSKSDSESKSNMGSGISQEPAENVDIKELTTRNVVNGYHMEYDFPENATCITYIEYDAKRTFKKTTTTVEMLKDKSNLVKTLPSGNIYRHVNIWVGDKGAGLPEALENGVVGFKVEKAWINKNNKENNNNKINEKKDSKNKKDDKSSINDNYVNIVNEPEIILQWYDKEWKPLETEKIGEDKKYIYFEAKTPGYSSFAITDKQKLTSIEENKTRVETKLQQALKNQKNYTLKETKNGSVEKEYVKTNKPAAMNKVLIAFSLTLFMIMVEILILRKRL